VSPSVSVPMEGTPTPACALCGSGDIHKVGHQRNLGLEIYRCGRCAGQFTVQVSIRRQPAQERLRDASRVRSCTWMRRSSAGILSR
jgi:transposase-like protein